jgi:hypothetical protein
MQLLSAGEVCEVLSTSRKDSKGKTTKDEFPMRTLDEWIRRGYVQPFRAGRGTGSHRMFLLIPDVLAVAAGRWLRQSGVAIETCAAVMQVVMKFSEEHVLEEFKKEHTCIAAMNDGALPMLMRQDDLMEEMKKFERANDSVWHPVGIDLKTVYDEIERRTKQIAASRLATPKPKSAAVR